MKALLPLIFLVSSLLGFGENIQSFQAQFTQVITDETGKVLTYQGDIQAKRPAFVLWDYKIPEMAAKQIYINKVRVVIVQPELEQATVRHLSDEINFFDILASVVSIGEHRYKARYKNITFTLEEKNGVISSLSYLDPLENKVSITFTDQKQNRPIDNEVFSPIVPPDFDIIRE